MQPLLGVFGLVLATLCIDVGAASAAAAPTVMTGPAGNVRYTSAAVFGDVNPDGRATAWYFEYGSSTHYGLSTARVAAGSGLASIPVSAVLSSLQRGRLYHFRLVATNADGTQAGADVGFETPTSPPSVATGPAVDVHDSTSTLRASVDPHGLETIALFEYGLTTSYTNRTMSRSVGDGTLAVTFSLPTAHLTPDTTYHFRVVATNAAGTSAGSDGVFGTTGPAAVALGTATLIGAATVTLNGSVNANGHATSWHLQYGTSPSYGTSTLSHAIGPGVVPVAVSSGVAGLDPGTLYHFRLVAHSADGTVVSADGTFTTLGPTLAASTPVVTIGRVVTLSGAVPTGASNETVTVFAERLSDPSFALLATVLTNIGGRWTFTTRPRLETTYKVLWDGATSPATAVSVRPSVSLVVMGNSRFATHVTAARSLAHRQVRLQRLLQGTWRTVALQRLDRGSNAVFHPDLPAGAVRLRVMITAFQAGAGYMTGFSGSRLVRIS